MLIINANGRTTRDSKIVFAQTSAQFVRSHCDAVFYINIMNTHLPFMRRIFPFRRLKNYLHFKRKLSDNTAARVWLLIKRYGNVQSRRRGFTLFTVF